jgi:hypothetical protein
MMSEDRMRDMYDRLFTHEDTPSPYYDGPMQDEEDEEEESE